MADVVGEIDWIYENVGEIFRLLEGTERAIVRFSKRISDAYEKDISRPEDGVSGFLIKRRRDLLFMMKGLDYLQGHYQMKNSMSRGTWEAAAKIHAGKTMNLLHSNPAFRGLAKSMIRDGYGTLFAASLLTDVLASSRVENPYKAINMHFEVVEALNHGPLQGDFAEGLRNYLLGMSEMGISRRYGALSMGSESQAYAKDSINHLKKAGYILGSLDEVLSSRIGERLSGLESGHHSADWSHEGQTL